MIRQCRRIDVLNRYARARRRVRCDDALSGLGSISVTASRGRVQGLLVEGAALCRSAAPTSRKALNVFALPLFLAFFGFDVARRPDTVPARYQFVI